MFRKALVAALIASAFASVPVSAATRVVFVQVAPPELRQEVVPQQRRGFEWVPGHWGWRNQQHVWVRGSWIAQRRGYAYEQHRWVEDNGRWHQQPGRWMRTTRDRDGDGVPNRVDRAPNNPNRN